MENNDGNFDDLWPEFLRIGLEVGYEEGFLGALWGAPDRNKALIQWGWQPRAIRTALESGLGYFMWTEKRNG